MNILKGAYQAALTFIKTAWVDATWTPASTTDKVAIYQSGPAYADGNIDPTIYVTLEQLSAALSITANGKQVMTFPVAAAIPYSRVGYWALPPTIGGSVGPFTISSVKAAAMVVPFDCTLSQLCVRQYQNNSAATESVTFTLYKFSDINNTPTATTQSVTVSGDTTAITFSDGADVSLLAGDSWVLYVNRANNATTSSYISSVSFTISPV